MTMEGSSESDWQRPASSRGFNSSTLSDRNPRSLRANTLMLSGNNTSHDSGLKNLSDSYVLPQSSNYIKTSQISIGEVEFSDISLRQWLDDPGRTVDSIECLHIFTQIVEIVNLAHSQGIVVHNIRPSCFVMSSFNRVSFIESASCSDSGSDSLEEGSNSQTAEFKGLGQQEVSLNEAEDKKHVFPMKQILAMETNWYTSPEESSGGSSSCASDIYRLGVLLFELFCTFSSAEGKSATMSSLRHRLLPPQLLLKWPKEASFCLWLLHPEPSSRPKMDELLQSEFLNDPRDHLEDREVAIELKERIEDVELLLEFLLLMQQRKQEIADNLHKIISFISSDLEEVAKLQTIFMTKGGSNQDISPDLALVHPSMNITDTEDSGSSGSRKRVRPKIHDSMAYDDFENQDQKSETLAENEGGILHKNSRLMKNFKKLESAYFMTRRRSFKPIGKPLTRQSPISSDGRGSVLLTERSSVSNISTKEHYSENRPSGWINSFLEGLCKYHSFSTFKVKADLKQGDLLNSSNLVCSLGFDRDGEFFATAGVNKKIKVFEYESITNGGQDMHYPVVEMASRSKLSSICWNGYIKSQIASSNFEGVVQVWDVARGQVFTEMKEHERRVWSVDFSLGDPTMLASGSDDGSVKLWNINQGVSVGTIQTEANVCCVQFPSDSGRFLAFGSADHKIYYYDLRNSKMPLCTLIGHNKTVSYIRFIDSMNLVSASTDNTLKLWDLSMCSSRVLDCPLQSFTGHVNVKNFVGLSVSDGYIATGSETNEVFVYHKAFPMPALSYKYISTDPISGDEVDAAAQFISSVCWRGQSSTLVAANSIGNIKVLEMV